MSKPETAINKYIEGIENPSRAWLHVRYKLAQHYYTRRYDYTEAYRRLMDFRIKHYGPEQAVGGFDLGIGRLQFNFLQNQGLRPEDTLLDVGCGSLRGGQHYIDYLDVGNYTGMDISETAIEEGVDRLGTLTIANDATFVVNDDLRFEDEDLDGSFDYAIAQSVFTHLPKDMIEECLANIEKVVDGVFYATFFDGQESSPKDFNYNPETLVELAERHGHSARMLSEDDYPHPRGQRMMEFESGDD